MTFGPWQPLAEAHPPEGPGVLQVRAGQGADGLYAYPRGKSAMTYYDGDEEALAQALGRARAATAAATEPLFVRFAAAPDPRAKLAALLSEFTARFGAPPRFNSR